jgi:decaprenylphospho-beta-D-erythro-pentofuranosid-2-ulose 2-reductase
VKKILIIGATSAIAEATTRIWAQRGYTLFLVARNQERLNVLTKDLKLRGAHEVYDYLMDVNNFAHHLPMLDEVFRIFGNIDIVLIAHGTLSNQKECEHSVELSMQEIKTNALSVIALLTHLANYFENQAFGLIAVISSVAGDRGRANNYLYGSAKAMVTTFTSGLRQRLYRSNVAVLTIKPGLIDTPMTANFKKGLLWAKPAYVAKNIVRAIDQCKDELYTPGFWLAVMAVIKVIPHQIFKKIEF